jgi:hypothetical protein
MCGGDDGAAEKPILDISKDGLFFLIGQICIDGSERILTSFGRFI